MKIPFKLRKRLEQQKDEDKGWPDRNERLNQCEKDLLDTLNRHRDRTQPYPMQLTEAITALNMVMVSLILDQNRSLPAEKVGELYDRLKSVALLSAGDEQVGEEILARYEADEQKFKH